jgi:regulator of sigma E protease
MRLVIFAVFLNINLGLFNLLPIPALDGGKVLFAFLEKVSIRTREYQLPITIAGIIFLFVMMAFSTIMDLFRLIGGDLILS